MPAHPAESFKFTMGGVTVAARKIQKPYAPAGFGFVMWIRVDGESAWQTRAVQHPALVGFEDDELCDLLISLMASPQWPIN